MAIWRLKFVATCCNVTRFIGLRIAKERATCRNFSAFHFVADQVSVSNICQYIWHQTLKNLTQDNMVFVLSLILLGQAAAVVCLNGRNLSPGHKKKRSQKCTHSWSFITKGCTFIGPTNAFRKAVLETVCGTSIINVKQKPSKCRAANKTEPWKKQLRLQLSSKTVTTNSFRRQSLSFKVVITEKETKTKPKVFVTTKKKKTLFKTVGEKATLN